MRTTALLTCARGFYFVPYAFHVCSVGISPSIETGSTVCPFGQRNNLFFSVMFRRAPMFVFEFEKALFEFAYEIPHCAPLFALPPTFSSSTICCLFGPHGPAPCVPCRSSRRWENHTIGSAGGVLCVFRKSDHSLFPSSVLLFKQRKWPHRARGSPSGIFLKLFLDSITFIRFPARRRGVFRSCFSVSAGFAYAAASAASSAPLTIVGSP